MLLRLAEWQDQLETGDHGGDGGEGERDQDQADVARATAGDPENPGEYEEDRKEDREVLEVPNVDRGHLLGVAFKGKSQGDEATGDVQHPKKDCRLSGVDLSDVLLHPFLLRPKLGLIWLKWDKLKHGHP